MLWYIIELLAICELLLAICELLAICGIVWGTIVSNFVTSVVENIIMQVCVQVWKSDGYTYIYKWLLNLQNLWCLISVFK